MPFICSICGEESMRICVRCTKDACDNHLCEKCRKCSDCCECEVALATHPVESVREAMHSAAAHAAGSTETPVVEESTHAEFAAQMPVEVPVEAGAAPVAQMAVEVPVEAEPVTQMAVEVPVEGGAEAPAESGGSDADLERG